MGASPCGYLITRTANNAFMQCAQNGDEEGILGNKRR